MKKNIIFTVLSSILFLSAMISCSDNSEVDKQQDISEKKEKSLRSGPGYSWEFTTPNQNNPAEYYEPAGANRRYWLKQSAGYIRSFTLKVTKTNSSTVNPTFNIYSRENAGLKVIPSSISISSGSYATITFTHPNEPGAPNYGYAWSPILANSPIGTVATFTFNFGVGSGSLVEGSVDADMSYPNNIYSGYNFYDGDHIEVTVNHNL